MKKLILFLKLLIKNPRILWVTVFVSIVYGIFYYASIGYLRFESNTWGILSVPNFTKVLFRLRAPFLWEPTMRLNTGFGLTIDLAIFNVFIGLILMLLAFLNVSLLITSMKMPRVCKSRARFGRLASMFPAFLSGFACCAPTFVILWVSIFGGVATTFIAVARWAIPVSIILLAMSAYQGIKKLELC